MDQNIEIIQRSAEKIAKWVEIHNYKGYEPFDGLSSYLRPLTFNNTFLEQVLQQIIRRTPFNLRKILAVKPNESTKGRGYMAWGYMNMFELTKEQEYKDKAFECLDWLDKNKSPFYEHHSWGNHFDYSARSGKLPKFEPTIVWTSLIGHAFVKAYELFKNEDHLNVIKSIVRWIKELPKEETDQGTCLSYIAYDLNPVHNSNMLGASFLSKYAKITGDEEALKIAREAMLYSCSRQLDNGAWYYGHAEKYHWIDNFHTGYNLDSLKYYIDYSGNKEFHENLINGYKFWKEHFFEESGRPKYYYNNTFPVDIQCASQAIDTFALFSTLDNEALSLATKVAIWTINNMQDKKDGHMYFRIYSIGKKVKVPMIHWGQATTFKALTFLLNKLSSK